MEHGLISDPRAVRIGEQAGSNPGGLYMLPDIGTNYIFRKYYVKRAQSDEQGRTEALANFLYRAMGLNAPQVDYAPEDGMIYSAIVEGTMDMPTRWATDAAWLKKLQRGWLVDCWLANWDVLGMLYDNILTDAHGSIWRIDNGGALTFRAMGTPKGADFGPTVPELVTMRTGRKAAIFGSIPWDVLESAHVMLEYFDASRIIWAVANYGLSESLALTLIARREYILTHMEEAG